LKIFSGGQLEILPYITAKLIFTVEDGILSTMEKIMFGVGADLKMGVGSNLNLNATIILISDRLKLILQ